eukprot:364289-Chlamydomonas_euryale.AAC.6
MPRCLQSAQVGFCGRKQQHLEPKGSPVCLDTCMYECAAIDRCGLSDNRPGSDCLESDCPLNSRVKLV